MARLSIASWIGNAAAVMCGSWGAVSKRAREAGCSRQTVYEHAARVEQAVGDVVGGGADHQQLEQENQRLRRENEQLWKALDEAVDFPEAKRQQFVVTASAMGLSLTQILCLLSIVVPGAERLHRTEAAHGERRHRTFHPTRHHDVRHSAADDLGSVTNRIR